MRNLQNLPSFPASTVIADLIRNPEGRLRGRIRHTGFKAVSTGWGTGIDRYGAALPRFMGDSTWMDMDRH